MASDERNEILRAVEGDPTALSRLLKRYGPAVRHSIRGKIPRRFRSLLCEDDVMQESYAEAFLSIRRFDGDGSFAGWLLRIAKNNLLDAIRSLKTGRRGGNCRRVEADQGEDRAHRLFDVLDAGGTTPSRGAMRGELGGILERAMTELPDAYREVLRLYDLEGRTADEVAGVLKCSPAAVYMRRARARDLLREILGGFSNFL